VELLAVIVALALLLVVFLAIGKYYPGTGADVLDWQPTRSYEDEIRLEVERDLLDQQERARDLKDE
jgi:hypothetical protein